ncbi:hypothetical protein M0R45_019685 [Rubus argutus]|uniref:Ubiquitin-like protease family profile domain-containing protein n=1 Tax=Rubus argutus TaxID=59490 RepID=A0AAW1X9L1_RUBAR
MDASNKPPMSDIDSHTQDLVNVSDINHLQYNGIRFDKLSSEDLKGKDFKTVEEADAFYYAYAKAMGFDVRSDYKRFSARTKDRVTSRRLLCSAQGKRREEYMNREKRVRRLKKETRFNCPCLFKVSYCKEKDSYIVDDFITEHSHKLAETHESHLLRSHRSVQDAHLALATSMQRVWVKPCHTYEYIVDKVGGFSNVGFTIKDLYNKLNSRRREILLDGDAEAALAYMRGKVATDSKFFCQFSIDEDNRLATMFWRDSNSLLDYSCFGDVVLFDSTYKTNHYEKPLVLFVGSNNHLSTTVFGFALLIDKTIETYTWVLEMFISSMNNKKPIAILTDRDEAMRRAIEVSLDSDGQGEGLEDGTWDRIDDRKRSTEPAPTSIITLCSSNDFHKTVLNLSDPKVAAVNEMEFGSLLRIGCPTLIQPICKMMVDNVDTVNSAVSVHGMSFSLTPFKFAKIMGLAEGGGYGYGYAVYLPPTISWTGKGWLRDVVCNNDGRILVSKLKETIRHRLDVDDVFRIAFYMFALTTILCPGNTDEVDDRLVLLFMSTGCILFLQLLYFDIVGEGCIYVDRSLASVQAWGNLDVKELVAPMQLFGGYESRSVPIKRAKRTDDEAVALQNEGNVGSGMDRAVRKELWGVKLELSSVKKDMGYVNAEVGSVLYALRMTVESLVKSLAEFQEQCASIAVNRIMQSGQIQNNEKIAHLNTVGNIGNVTPTCADFNMHSYADGTHEDKRDDQQGQGPKQQLESVGSSQIVTRTVVTENRDAILYWDEISCLASRVYVNSLEQANTVEWSGTYEEWVEYSRTVCRFGRFSGCIGVCQMIFVSLHEGESGGHWYLMVVHPMRRIDELWDSSPTIDSFNSRLETTRSALKHLDDVLDHQPIDYFGAPSTFFGDINIIVPENVPVQSNDFDCDIFVIQNMQDYGTNWWEEYDSEEHRSTLLLQCVKPPVNERYDEFIPRQAQGYCSAQPPVDVLGDDVAVRIKQGQKGSMGARSDGRGVHRKT